MKFCKDCKHCQLAALHIGVKQFEFATCAASKVETVDPVSGVPAVKYAYCEFVRKDEESCGPDAIKFEAKA